MSYISSMQQRAKKAFAEKESNYSQFLTQEMEKIKELHSHSSSGLEISSYRSALLDTLIQHIFQEETEKLQIPEAEQTLCILAIGGYGNGFLNPRSDIDLLILLDKNSDKISKQQQKWVQCILCALWDLGIKLGSVTRSINECLAESKINPQSKTALMNMRLLCGNDKNVSTLCQKFESECVQKDNFLFFEERQKDIKKRHEKYSFTVFLQEPHVKESCGGMRDFDNVRWLARVKRGYTDIQQLAKHKILSVKAVEEMQNAYDFLHRVRNELHFHMKSTTDVLTLRLQGIVATSFHYPEETILRRCESFMRDYYRHTRALYQHTNSILEIFEIEIEEKEKKSWSSWLTQRREKLETFDGFIAHNKRISLLDQTIFQKKPQQMMSVFLHCQQRELTLSPPLRKQLKAALPLVTKEFCYSKKNRETFRTILEQKGQVAKILREMHRVGFLGAYLPEFADLDCLVQHEFFHRYTADEHTLRCIEQLDELIDSNTPNKAIYQQLLREMEDPYALYLSLIMHDTGRAQDISEHTYGSISLTSQVCKRLNIRGNRLKRIMFLVDHHLTFWHYATTRNLEETAVIEEFSKIMKEPDLLKALFLFTYADSNGTSEESWTPWKESLMLQLYHTTLKYMLTGKTDRTHQLKDQKQQLLISLKQELDAKYHEELESHLQKMPDKYFVYRDSSTIKIHVRAARRFLKEEQLQNNEYHADMRWINHRGRGYTELVITCWNKPLLLEKACCALASEQINIISADVFTREDGIVCDIFRISTVDWEPIKDKKTQQKVLNTFIKLCQSKTYEPELYLKERKNFLSKNKNEGAIPFPVQAYVTNDMSEKYTVLNVQAQDRIGLLHDLFLAIGKCGLATINARICTDKGAALDTIYIANTDQSKILDEEKHRELEAAVQKLLRDTEAAKTAK